MKNNVFMKVFVFVIILLFIGLSFNPIINAKAVIKKTTPNTESENKSLFFGKIIGHAQWRDGTPYTGNISLYLLPIIFRLFVFFIIASFIPPLHIFDWILGILLFTIICVYTVNCDDNGNFELNLVRPGFYLICLHEERYVLTNPMVFDIGLGQTYNLNISIYKF